MTSSINPNNIDGTYPVAGQDNNSQGFRDNFTATKTNFTYASSEITDLQNKAVLKSALTGTTLNNNMGGALLIDAQLQDMSETKVALGTVATGNTATVDYSAGPYYTFNTSGTPGTISLAFTNFSSSTTTSRARVQANVANVLHTLTLPTAVNVNNTGIQGLSGNVITFGATGVYEFEFETNNGGGNISIFDLNRALNVYTNPIFLTGSEDLASAAAVSLTTPVTYIATGVSGETATLAAGSDGQVKMFAMTTDGGGDMVITVTNAAWGGAGTITLGDVGDGCTLLYTNSKWCCVGNNGCSFA
jgi:hypothetical protein